MNILFTKTHALLQKVLTPWSHMDYFYDGWMHFFGLQNNGIIHCHYKAWKSQDNSDCVWLKESRIHLGWLEGE